MTLESQQVYKIDNKTQKVEKNSLALIALISQSKLGTKCSENCFEQKCKVENQLTKAKYNSQFLLLPSTLRIKKPKIFKEISVSEFK
jgi:hypothetical protein